MRYWIEVVLFLEAQLWANFKSAYVKFELPDSWHCELSQSVWVCQSTQDARKKESVILSIATIATEWDTLENYEAYLKQPRTIQTDSGQTLTSEVRYTRKRNINGHEWVDSLQYNSELPDYWARYVATVHTTPSSKLAILVTYIVSKDRYKELAPEFERMISSLVPNDEVNLNIASQQGDLVTVGADKLGPIQKDILKNKLNLKPSPKSGPEQDNTNLMILGGAIGFTLLLLFRKKKPKKSKPRRAA